ncbi:MAG: glycosyltransferase [Acidimicrobiales bacterium]
MRSRLRFFALVGLVATALDVGTFLALRDRGVLRADVAALAVAAVVAYLGNRMVTFRGAIRQARWVSAPGAFAATAVVAGLVDLAVLALASLATDPGLFSKLVAIAVAAVVRWTAYRWVLFNEVRREMEDRVPRPEPTGTHRLTVVVPAYNEGSTIELTISTLLADLEPAVGVGDVEILVVDDGSADDTAEAAARAGARVMVQPRNRGKGAAVRAGVLGAAGRFVVFTDADLAYPPHVVVQLLAELEDGWDMVVGSRRHTETTTLVRARRLREVGGRVINWLTHLVLLGHFRDTQCGVKGFRTDIGRAVFERTTIDGFAFDVELFLIAEQDRLSVREVPVLVSNRQGSSVRIVADTALLFRDLVRIRRMAGWGRYRPSPAQAEVLASGRSGTG